ncbi:MAG: TRAP transporter large permease [Clostridiales Family XIII bacterium]|jgi:tripartite ATP-independent transporter DctM subunit|nr:TRAP transporter large permease [Clostridiales Family XIII bacterium]
MSPITIGIIVLVGFLVIMFLGLPVPISMMVSAIVGISLMRSPGAAFQAVASDIFQNFGSYTLTVAPIFGLMGFLASYSGIGESLFNVADKFIGHKRGGITSAVQVASAMFGAICGSIPATMGTMVTVALPEMEKRNYEPKLSTAGIAAAASLAVLIPPSATMIIYGVTAEESIGRLFIAGIFPGIMLMVFQIIAIMIVVKRHPNYAPVAEKSTWAERWAAVRKGGLVEVVIIFMLSVGGMFIGWFTPTEGASIGAVGMLLIGLIERKINFTKLMTALVASAKLAAMVFFIITCGTLFGRMFTLSTIPTQLAKFVTTLDVPVWVLLGIILIIYFILGMFIDGIAIILITVPIFSPILAGLGYDGIWYGVLIVMVLILGGLTPPVGLNCFYMKGFCKDVPLSVIFSGVWPFVICIVLAMIIIMIFPPIATWLPTVLFGL